MKRKLAQTKVSLLKASAIPTGDSTEMQDQPIRGAGMVSFSGHETFTLRHGWLKKAFDAAAGDTKVFANDDAMVDLGVGKNMVRSIRHWALAADVLRELPGTRGTELSKTDFSELIFGSKGTDPFLEDLNTLWMIHWKLARNERRSTGWCWIFNLLHNNEFTRDSLLELFLFELKRRNIVAPSTSSIERDIDCAIRTYVGTRAKGELFEESLECPLVELQLIAGDSDGVLFRFARGPKASLSDRVFLHCLLEFWDMHSPQDSLAFSEIAFAFGSPGLVFKLDENSIAARLEELEKLTKGALIYDETAGLKQMFRKTKLDRHTLLAQHYEESKALIGE
jgi:Protein of unknown function (DUF4007)